MGWGTPQVRLPPALWGWRWASWCQQQSWTGHGQHLQTTAQQVVLSTQHLKPKCHTLGTLGAEAPRTSGLRWLQDATDGAEICTQSGQISVPHAQTSPSDIHKVLTKRILVDLLQG